MTGRRSQEEHSIRSTGCKAQFAVWETSPTVRAGRVPPTEAFPLQPSQPKPSGSEDAKAESFWGVSEKKEVPYFGVLIMRILLFGVLH